MNNLTADPISIETIDARGLSCPLPLLKAKQGLNSLMPGEQLQVLATDSGSVRDFHAFAELSGHKLKHFNENNGVYYYLLVKNA